MISSVLVRLDDVNKQASQVQRIGRYSDLVAYYAKVGIYLPKVQHGPDRVLSAKSKYPRATYDEVLIYQLAHRQLTLQLGLPIDIQWRKVLAVRLSRIFTLPVKYIVRADAHQLATQFLEYPRDVQRAARGDGAHIVLVFCLLSLIHGHSCRTVNHCTRSCTQVALPYRLRVRDVQPLIAYRASVLCAAVNGRETATDSRAPAPRWLIHHAMAQQPQTSVTYTLI